MVPCSLDVLPLAAYLTLHMSCLFFLCCILFFLSCILSSTAIRNGAPVASKKNVIYKLESLLLFTLLLMLIFLVAFSWAPQICPGLNANEIQIPYDKHHKVSSLVKRHQNTQFCQIWSNMKMSDNLTKYEVPIEQYLHKWSNRCCLLIDRFIWWQESWLT